MKSSEAIAYSGQDRAERAFEQIIGTSSALGSVLEQVERVAPTDSTVLVQGETGTGKELIARAIHNISPRWGRALIKLNCAAIPLDLLESELFGHVKGAFTGAIAQKIGRFEMADKGTLFLDEVGDIPPALQPKLLRVLQEQQFERLGSGRTHQVDVRLIAATNRDLAGMVARSEFRSDLYYRLNVFPISLPPFRERRKDIPALVEHFVEIFGQRMSRDIRHIPPETMAAFSSYHWPGNIRELQNLVVRAVILAQDGLLPNPLPTSVVSMAPSPSPATIFANSEPPEPMTLRDSERALILRALQRSGWRIAGKKGALAPGQLADPAILSANYFSIPDEEIKQLESVLTIVGGKIVYATEEFSKLAPPALPVSPNWSPIKKYGGYANRQDQVVGASHSAFCSHVEASALGREKSHLQVLGDLGSWGLGCNCFAF